MSAEASATVNKPLCSVHNSMVLQEQSGAVAVLTLNRPDTRNALSAEMLAELADAFRAVGADAGIRAVVLAANGPAFCAGHDLKEITACRQDPDGGRASAERLMTGCSELMLKIVQLPQPVI